MATQSPSLSTEFEFSDSQNELIGGLARKMGLVGLVMIFFGALQMLSGVTSLFASRNPARVLEAAEAAGVGAEQMDMLRQALAGGFWSSPITVSAIAYALAGLILLIVGVWTQQAAGGFAGIVRTKGQDISRLMNALGALSLKYGLMYYMILIAALVSLLSLVIALWQAWRGGPA